MKRLLAVIMLSAIGSSLFAQRIIENPTFSATTASYVKIKRIELRDTVTKLDFEVTYFPNWWISVSSSETFLQNSNGGEKLYVKRAAGIKLNEQHWTPESGVNRYTLYFPAIGKDVEKVDFIEESWRIFDIDLTGKTIPSFLPEQIKGNWFKADGSNEWVYGIYDDKVIYKDKIWNSVLLNNKGKIYELTLRDGTQQEKIYLKPKKENLLIGTSPDDLELYGISKTYKPSYSIRNDEEYGLPVLKRDTAIYKGFVKGYHPKMGNTGMAYVNDIIIHEQNSLLFTIEPDGSFYCKVPMIHSQNIYIRILGMQGQVYLEPGKTVFQYIDLSEYTAAYRDNNHSNKRERKSLFMGDVARVNSDLLAMDTIQYYDHNKIRGSILEMNGNDFKAHCLSIMKKEQEAMNKFVQVNQISKKAQQIKKMQIAFKAYENILSMYFIKEYAYREKHKIPRDQREIPLEKEQLGPEYFDFINPGDLNNPISLISGDAYNTLINRVRFHESVRNHYGLVEIKSSVQVYDSISKKEITVDKVDSTFMIDPKTNEKILISGRSEYEQIEANNMKTYFGLDSGFAKELMLAQSKSETMKGTQKPLSDDEKRELKNKISNEFIFDYVVLHSNIQEEKIKQQLADNKNKTGYVINDTPKAQGDKLFDAIVSKYKGKVVFVDFWATWCGPCRSGIDRIKPLKEALKDEKIEFVYITDQSSPTDTWNMMIPDIKGEHFRVERDEWNHLASKFNINGIPHYVLVDKNGTVVNEGIYFASSNDELEKMFREHLK